jgi:DNA (cytosine-5)-methyltransferase 1
MVSSSTASHRTGAARTKSPPIKVLDLFSGAGGLTAGLHRASRRFVTVQAVESDLSAAASYRQNHGNIVHAGTIDGWLRHGSVPEVDLIVGGPPCQGFSTLGKQDVEDERNGLWKDYAETILKADPKYFIVENVATFLKSRQFHEFFAATDPMGKISEYTFRARVLNAADYGSPQARKRAVLIGHHRDLPFPGWPEPTYVGRHKFVRDILLDVPFEWDSIDLPNRAISVGGLDLPGIFLTKDLHVGRYYSPLSMNRFSRIPEGGNRFNLPDELLCDAWRNHRTGAADVMGRLHWNKPSVTIRTEFFKPEKGRYLHPEANRAITHYEAALLQGFSENYKWVGSKCSIARQIGNAVPIPLGAAIGRRLLAALDAVPS